MRDGLEYESLTAAGLGAGSVYWAITSKFPNQNPVVTAALTLTSFFVLFLVISKISKNILKSEEGKSQVEIDKEWQSLFTRCVNEIGLENTEQIAEETKFLISKQRNVVSSVDYHTRVRDSLYEHINLQSLILGGKLQFERQQKQQNATVEKQSEEIIQTVDNVVQGSLNLKSTSSKQKISNHQRLQAVLNEENYLLDYLQKFPQINNIEQSPVFKTSSGQINRPDFVVTNTQGERYIIELKMTKNTPVAERTVKDMFSSQGAKMVGSQVLGEGNLGKSIIFIGKIPSMEEE